MMTVRTPLLAICIGGVRGAEVAATIFLFRQCCPHVPISTGINTGRLTECKLKSISRASTIYVA
jgi:hypothetical protein